ncbi:MAG: hypothetical protein LOD91_03650 [Limnochordales bacterium]
MRKAVLVLAAAFGLAAGFVMGALLAAGFQPWPAATPGSQPGSRAGPVSAGTAGFSLDDLPPASLPAPAEAAGYRIAMGDVVPGGGPELVVGVTLLSGDGLVAVFGRRAGGWEPLARREGFAAIDLLEVRSVTGAGAHELLVYDEHDELTGAFYRRRGLTILKERDGQLVPVWSGTLYEEAYSLDPPMAERVVTAVAVTAGDGQLRVQGARTRSRRQPDGTYADVEEIPVADGYRWDPASFRFVKQRSASRTGRRCACSLRLPVLSAASLRRRDLHLERVRGLRGRR